MSLGSLTKPSPFVEVKQMYWETRRSFGKVLGRSEDSSVVASDSELDIKLELLQAADRSFGDLMTVLFGYWKALKRHEGALDRLGSAMAQYGARDPTAAGRILCITGEALVKSGRKYRLLEPCLASLFQEVQTFQFKATADALQTVARMEAVRRSYRSGLMWLKSASADLDPDDLKKMRTYRKVQGHVRDLKVRFDRAKLESMQKIDLLLLSRCNLFSLALAPYCKGLARLSRASWRFLDAAARAVQEPPSFNFVALKELNQCSAAAFRSFIELSSCGSLKRPSADDGPKDCGTRSSADRSKDGKTKKDQGTLELGSLSGGDIDQEISTSRRKNDHLIDLHEKRLSLAAGGDVNLEDTPEGSKYSDDLRHIEFDPRPTWMRQPLYQIYQFYDEECNVNRLGSEPQRQSDSGHVDLRFWKLVESQELSEPTEAESDGILPPAKSQNAEPVSKWTDILEEFDPFSEKSGSATRTLVDHGSC